MGEGEERLNYRDSSLDLGLWSSGYQVPLLSTRATINLQTGQSPNLLDPPVVKGGFAGKSFPGHHIRVGL
jgi:hypothetical protein